MIEKALTLSTCHIPLHISESPGLNLEWDGYEIRVTAHEYGWILFLCTEDDRDTPDWLSPIFKYAVENDVTYLNFDRDGQVYDQFHDYNW